MSEPENEIGRELKVSELKPRTVVVLMKDGHPVASTVWVVAILHASVMFTAGVTRTDFIAKRVGPDREQITDNTGTPMKMYEYLGAV